MGATDPVERARAAVRRSDAFETDNGAFTVTTIALEAAVTVTSGDDGPPVYRVTVTAPTLDAVVDGESVARVVQEGWAETFERRLVDPHQVGRGLDPIDPTVVVEADTVTVRMRFSDPDPVRGAENAKALAEFVEGTWVQGLVPGYEYRDPARTLLERATARYEDDEQ